MNYVNDEITVYLSHLIIELEYDQIEVGPTNLILKLSALIERIF